MKRKNASGDQSELPVKQKGITLYQFKLMLKDLNTVQEALEKFSDQAEQEENNDHGDIVKDYLLSDGNGSEFYEMLDANKKATELTPVFQVFYHLIHRIGSDLNRYKSVALEITNRLLDTHMSSIYHQLNVKNNAIHQKVVLKLLTAMACLNEMSAKAVSLQVNWKNPCFLPLFSRTDQQNPDHVRFRLLSLINVLLLKGGDSTIFFLFNHKVLMRNVFDGLFQDSATTIGLILPTILTKVLKNPVVSKTTKLEVFNYYTLKKIAFLYVWNGSKKWTHKITDDFLFKHQYEDKPSEITSDQALVHDLIHKILGTLCTSNKWGIIFHDKTVGTSGKNLNHTLTQLFEFLNKIRHIRLVQQLLVDILRACPDQLPHYLPSIRHTIVSRPSRKWIENVEFLKSIFINQVPPPVILRRSDSLPIPRLVAICMITSVPSIMSGQTLIQNLRKPILIVRHKMLELTNCLFNRIQTIFHCCENETWRKKSFGKNTTEVKCFIEKFTEAAIKALPDVATLLECWHLTFIQDSSINIVKKELGEKDETQDLPTVNVVSHLILILQILSSYQDMFPQVFSNSTINFQKLLSSVQLFKKQKEEEESSVAILYLYIVKLITSEGSQRNLWERETAPNKSTMYHLMSILLESSDKKLQDIAQHLIAKALISTGLFYWNKDEILLWLVALRSCRKENQEAVLTFMDTVFQNLIANPYPHMDTVADFTDLVANLKVNHREVEGKEFNICSIMDDLEEVGETEEIADQSFISSRFPFSILGPAALETMKSYKGLNDYISKFVSKVLVNILHSQYDPTVLCLLLQKYDEFLSPNLQVLFKLWLPGHSVDLIKSTTLAKLLKSKKPFNKLFEKVFLSDYKFLSDVQLQQKLFECLKILSLDGASNAVKQTLFYLTIEIDKAHKKAWNSASVIEFHFILLRKLLSTIEELLSQNVVASDNLDNVTSDSKEKENMVLNLFSNINEKNNLNQICLTILHHPCIKQIFLQENNLNRTVESVLIVELTKFLKWLKGKEVTNSIEEFIVELKEALSLQILNKIQGIKNDEALEDCGHFWHLIQTLIPFFPIDTCQNIIEIGLEVSANFWGSKNKFLTPLIHLLCFILQELIDNSVYDHSQLLNTKTLQCFTSLLINDPLEIVEQTFLNLLKRKPSCPWEHVDNILSWCLTNLTSTRAKMAVILLQNKEVLSSFESCIKIKKVKKKYEDYAVVILAYLQSLKKYSQGSPIVDAITKIYWPLIINWIKSIHEDNAVDACMSQLMKHLLEVIEIEADGLDSLLTDLSTSISSSLPNQHLLEVYETVLNKICQITPRQGELSATFIFELVKLLRIQLMQKLEKSPIEDQIIHLCLKYLKVTDIAALQSSLSSTVWNSFIKYSLRLRYTDALTLHLLSQMSKVVYSNLILENILRIPVLHQMVMEHSLFMDIILDEDSKREETKEYLISFMIELVSLDSTYCNAKHIPILLGAYNATLKPVDQKLLYLLHLYEKKASLRNQKIILWGPTAVDYYSIKKAVVGSGLKQNDMEDIFNLLHSEVLWLTAMKFPLHRKILLTHPVMDGERYEKGADIYDPCFLLPLFDHLLTPGNFIDCYQFVEIGALAVTFAALSSYDFNMRGAALYILKLFYECLEVTNLHHKKLLIAMLNLLHQSLSDSTQRLPCIITVFLAKVSRILINAEDVMFLPLNEFLWLKPSMDIANVPEFYKLFKSSKLNHSEERSWLLTFLADGIRDENDYEIFQKKFVFRYLLSFVNCPLSDKNSKILALKVLEAACSIKRVALHMVKNMGLLVWIHNMINKCFDDELLECLRRLVSICWSSLSDGLSLTEARTFNPALDCESNANKNMDVLIFRQQMALIMSLLPVKQFT